MIKARMIIEIVGAPREHVDQVMQMVVKKMKEEKNLTVFNEHIEPSEPIELENAKNKDFFSSFVEFEIKVTTLTRILELCFDYMPSTVEILEPDSLDFDSLEAANIINDLLARLHRYDMLVKNLSAENTLLKKKLEQK